MDLNGGVGGGAIVGPSPSHHVELSHDLPLDCRRHGYEVVHARGGVLRLHDPQGLGRSGVWLGGRWEGLRGLEGSRLIGHVWYCIGGVTLGVGGGGEGFRGGWGEGGRRRRGDITSPAQGVGAIQR